MCLDSSVKKLLEEKKHLPFRKTLYFKCYQCVTSKILVPKWLDIVSRQFLS